MMMKNEYSGYRGEGAVDSTEHSEFDFQSRELGGDRRAGVLQGAREDLVLSW